MKAKTGGTMLPLIICLATGFVYGGITGLRSDIKDLKEQANEPVIVAQPPLEPIGYLEYLNDWTQEFTLLMVEFETQTLELNQSPKLYTDKQAMNKYSGVINDIMTLTSDLIVYPIDKSSEYLTAHEYFKESAIAYYKAMTSMWDVATFYQLDVNSDIINESFDKSIHHLKDGIDSFQKGATALH